MARAGRMRILRRQSRGLRLFIKGWHIRLAGGFEGREVTTGS